MPAADTGGPPDLTSGLELLERAVSYTRTSLHTVSEGRLHNPTPCRDWDLRALLEHMSDSLAALDEAARLQNVAVRYAPSQRPDLVSTLREQACALLGVWTSNTGAHLIRVAGNPMDAGLLAAAGALEISVHGWDVARACNDEHPIPSGLAGELLAVLPRLVSCADRPARFAAARAVAPTAGAPQRLLAALGRDPG